MRFNILTIFPELFQPFCDTSLIGDAAKQEIITIDTCNIRDYTEDNHHTVDDTPYGGGAGMVMKIEPIDRALSAIQQEHKTPKANRKTIVLAARGQQFTQAKALEYSKLDELTLICGRYEGIDQRVADYLADEEISVGPYVLNGGEVAAMVVIEAVARLIPGVIGNPGSLVEESHSQNWKPQNNDQITGTEYPQYTKPVEYKGWRVPEVLLSGNHEEIRKWREEHRS